MPRQASRLVVVGPLLLFSCGTRDEWKKDWDKRVEALTVAIFHLEEKERDPKATEELRQWVSTIPSQRREELRREAVAYGVLWLRYLGHKLGRDEVRPDPSRHHVLGMAVTEPGMLTIWPVATRAMDAKFADLDLPARDSPAADMKAEMMAEMLADAAAVEVMNKQLRPWFGDHR